MLRSLYSGISGLRVHQTMMDVTGNNIANVNTTGFKGSQTVFQDTLSQMMQAAGAPQPGAPGAGGTNPAQVGLGVRLAGVQTNFGQGAAQTTGRNLDLMIQGDGFFAVQKGTEQLYTRAGSFNFDANGSMVTTDGNFVLGWNAATGNVPVPPTGAPEPITLPGDVESFTISPDGSLVGVLADGTKRTFAQVSMANFVNPGGLEKAGGSAYRATVNSGDATIGTAGTGGMGALQTGALEMSNVDLGQEFTNLIIAQRGFQANTKVISTSDELLNDLVNLKR
ncbi:flagellar basal-body rod protein FlgF [Planomonospora parontospora]|uniref:flagellar basal-body rod protein FlgF n=1 Tax=Planomonospora parontospora TaxID=58119 RepID=UPI0016712083|nr:flagellar basal-body rod protein FlgF [Planomonospora parontospora]GGL47366.1 flagellar basal body protein [Planomonospora parontospora subsp. antibiotica]GII19874.1 flagellar basal body protein [Planomonospora parontospora subsp. antibiotica]